MEGVRDKRAAQRIADGGSVLCAKCECCERKREKWREERNFGIVNNNNNNKKVRERIFALKNVWIELHSILF